MTSSTRNMFNSVGWQWDCPAPTLGVRTGRPGVQHQFFPPDQSPVSSGWPVINSSINFSKVFVVVVVVIQCIIIEFCFSSVKIWHQCWMSLSKTTVCRAVNHPLQSPQVPGMPKLEKIIDAIILRHSFMLYALVILVGDHDKFVSEIK